MDEIKIEKGIPIPISHNKGQQYPFDKMEVGDSFYVEGKKAASLNVYISTFRRRSAENMLKEFKCLSDLKGVRCWRKK